VKITTILIISKKTQPPRDHHWLGFRNMWAYTIEVFTLGFFSSIFKFSKAADILDLPFDRKKCVTRSSIINSFIIYCNTRKVNLVTRLLLTCALNLSAIYEHSCVSCYTIYFIFDCIISWQWGFVYRYTCIPIYLYTDIIVYQYTCIPIYLYTDIIVYQYTCIPIYLYTYILVYQYTCIPIYLYTDILVNLNKTKRSQYYYCFS